MRMLSAALALVVAATVAQFASPSSKAAAQTADIEMLTEKEVPQAVAKSLGCKTPSGPVTRRPFAGGSVFLQPCNDGGQALIRVVLAKTREGDGARRLEFHRPEGRRMGALSSVVLLPAENEIAGTTGRLTRRICRAEGRWRMEGKEPAPGLVYWRQTRDCEGKTGWQTVLGRPR